MILYSDIFSQQLLEENTAREALSLQIKYVVSSVQSRIGSLLI